ncbi:hypothetical protein Plhal304r1_c064g0151311 [Plasmopara halstedii]
MTADALKVITSNAPKISKTESTSRGGSPYWARKSTVGAVDTHNSGPNVHDAHAVSAMSNGSVRQSATLIAKETFVDGFEKPLQVLINIGTSSNSVRAQFMTGYGVSLLNMKK